MDHQVLTSEGFGMKDPAEKQGAPAPSAVPKKEVDYIIRRFRFPSAPMGKSAISIPIIEKGMVKKDENGQPKRKMQELRDQVFSLSKNSSKQNYFTLKAEMLKMGLEVADKIIYKDSSEEPEPEPVVPKYRWKLGHPDNAPEQPVTGKYTIGVEGDSIALEVVDGFITTDDERVYTALTELGFSEADKTLIDEEEDPEKNDPEKKTFSDKVKGIFNGNKPPDSE